MWKMAGARNPSHEYARGQALGVGRGNDVVLLADDHRDRQYGRRERIPKKYALRAPGEVGVGNAPQRRLRSIEALELEDLLDHVGADKARISDKGLQHRL